MKNVCVKKNRANETCTKEKDKKIREKEQIPRMKMSEKKRIHLNPNMKVYTFENI